MDKGIFTALSGGIAKAHQLEIIANNLANVDTPAFKRDTATFNEYLPELRRPDTVEALDREIKSQTMFDGRPPGDKSFVELDGIYSDFQQGTLKRTGRTTDLALEGKGFFEVLGPEGDVIFTRQGNLKISEDGVLVTANGLPVLSANYERTPEDRIIRIRDVLSPEQRTVDVAEQRLQFSSDGVISQGEIQLNTLAIREFHEPQYLEKVGNAYFRNTDERNLKEGSQGTRLHQGAIESSNVNPLREMTLLIEASRAYEAQLQAIKTFNDIDGKTANEIARG
ncbi:MAG: flagellar basal-body rod protein FlgF [Bdellovibrionales bacterium]|nr:flagellar basal-body rod protein FlgF [Bdellovibrionales bacterium]